jgi:hypothetical protein
LKGETAARAVFRPSSTSAVSGLIAANSAANVYTVSTLLQTISNPPTQAQGLAIQTKLNDLIVAMQRA